MERRRPRSGEAIKARRQLELAQIAAMTACEKFSAFANAPELAAAVKSLNQFAQGPVWLEFGRKPVHAGDSGIRQQPGGVAFGSVDRVGE
jgi:hypothetical protein